MTRPIYTFTCLICNAQFSAKYPLAKYCSLTCKESAKYRRTGPKKRNRTPVPRELVSRRQSEFRTCGDCGEERCPHTRSGLAPSPEQIAAAREVVKLANIAAGVMR